MSFLSSKKTFIERRYNVGEKKVVGPSPMPLGAGGRGGGYFSIHSSFLKYLHTINEENVNTDLPFVFIYVENVDTIYVINSLSNCVLHHLKEEENMSCLLLFVHRECSTKTVMPDGGKTDVYKMLTSM